MGSRAFVFDQLCRIQLETDGTMAESFLSHLPIQAVETLLDGAFDGIAIHEAGKILYCNQRLASMFGYAVEEMVGRHTLEFTAPEEKELIRSSSVALVDRTYVSVGMRKDGTRFYGEVHSIPFDWNGRHLKLAAMKDLTSHHDADTRLRESEHKYRQIVESAEEGILQVDPEYVINFANPKMAELLGYSPEELIGRPLVSLFWDATREDVDRRAGLRKQGVRTQFDICYRRKDGSPVWMINSVTSLYDTSGKYVGALGLHTDITKRREAETALRESSEMFHSTFEQAAVGITHTSPEGRWIRVNRRFAEIVGYSCEELLNQPFRNFLHPEEVVGLDDRLAAMAEGRISTLEKDARYLRKDGSVVWVHLTRSLVRDTAGEPKYYVTIAQDISDRKAAEQKLLDHRTQMFNSSKMSALGEMAGGIAHEINNPLSIIRAYVGVLRDGIETGRQEVSQLLNSVEKIDATVIRISQIVRSLMGFARDAEKDPFQPVSVRQIVTDTLDLCETRLRQERIEIACSPVPADLLVECRRVPISQVVLNLLNNAADAIASLPARWILISVRDLGDQVEIAIEDSGRGILPEVSDKIMMPFFTTKGSGHGTGLGLSVSKKIAESHRGTLTLDAESPHTRFVLKLPKRQPAQ
jgi:PAS domain S-box-containing protein